MRLSLRQAIFIGNKVLIGFQVVTLVFKIHCSSSYHYSSDTGSGDMFGWRLVYLHCGGACYGFSHIVHSFLLPSSSGKPPFLRTFSLSDTMSALVRMHALGIIRLVWAHGAMGLAELPSWVGLIDQVCCS